MNIGFYALSLIDILLAIVVIVDFVLSTAVFFNRKENKSSKFFAIAAYSATTWVLSMFLFRIVSNLGILIIPTKLLYIAGILIAHNLLLFSYRFLNESEEAISRKVFITTTVFTGTAISLIIFSETVIKAVSYIGTSKFVSFGNLYIPYSILMFFYFVLAYSNFFRRFFKSIHVKDIIASRQLSYVITGTGLSVLVGLICDIILPYFGNFDFYWLGPFMNILFVVATTYSIFKHQLFSLRVITTEIFVFSLWIIILTRTLLSQSIQDQLINAGLLFSTIVVGVLLVRSVIKEVEAREQIEKLAKDLEAANERLKELDQLKSEFVSIASHQLRSPLAAIKGYASLIIEGSFGKVPPAITQAVDRIFDSAKGLVIVVEDFLNISRIEQGRMKYDFAIADIEPLVKSVVDELLPSVKKANLSISFTTDNKPPYKSNIDIGKMKQVVTNLLDNAIKYTPKGSITVRLLKQSGGKLRIAISDTGIGMGQETIALLFEKFSRAKDANKTNVMGTGLGLYVAKEMVKANGGKIWAESEGKGKGSTFIVELEKAPAH
jgi:signal transduction histidine kinase